MNLANPYTIRRLGMIEAAIATEALTYKEIAVAAHMSEAYACRIMRDLAELQIVRIAGWRLSGRMWGAAYRWGKGRPARRPKPMNSSEGQRMYRARIKQDPEANEFYLARLRAKDRASRAAKRKTPNTWLSALGVAA